jgi:hypothetical protein
MKNYLKSKTLWVSALLFAGNLILLIAGQIDAGTSIMGTIGSALMFTLRWFTKEGITTKPANSSN